MSLKPTASSKTFEPVPAGSHAAYIFSLVDLGTQESNGMYGLKQEPKIRIGFETPGKTIIIEGEKTPMTIYKEYTNSLGQKAALRKHLEGWSGKPMTEDQIKNFDPSKLLGKKCLITVVHATSKTGNVYAKIDGMSALPDGMAPMPPMHHAKLTYDISQGEDATFQKFPDFLKEQIAGCLEWTRTTATGDTVEPSSQTTPPAEPLDDNIPF